MNGKRLATAAAFCALAIPNAFAQHRTGPADAARTTTTAPAAKAPQWPALLPRKGEPDAPTAWSQQDIELARARCTALLKNLPVVTVPVDAIREGPGCGAAAPVQLVSVGRSPQIALSPPPTITCDMVAALHRWLERDVQPLAKKHLGAPVIRIEAMSSYSCRNAYGRAGSRLSEHGKANALDISAFVTARGQNAMVLADWGPTARQIAAQAAADQGEPAERARPASGAPRAAQPDSQQAEAPAQPSPQPLASAPAAASVLGPGVSISIPGVTVLMGPQGAVRTFGLAPSRLGGPKPPARAALAPDAGGKTDFLRAVHSSACKLFNTVLGPEANNAHHNHFHVDLAERIKNTKICE
jgi:hypothetical protein